MVSGMRSASVFTLSVRLGGPGTRGGVDRLRLQAHGAPPASPAGPPGGPGGPGGPSGYRSYPIIDPKVKEAHKVEARSVGSTTSNAVASSRC